MSEKPVNIGRLMFIIRALQSAKNSLIWTTWMTPFDKQAMIDKITVRLETLVSVAEKEYNRLQR